MHICQRHVVDEEEQLVRLDFVWLALHVRRKSVRLDGSEDTVIRRLYFAALGRCECLIYHDNKLRVRLC